ncbi:MAG TPA: polysaccharide biosynthesis/export family protein [Candidatus Acidoferrum sp.]|nr:polysaccharide biosynthesis/export family protein [Candidatus Acidoferrum sp.]
MMISLRAFALGCGLVLAAMGASPTPAQIVHPGDQLNIQVYGQQTLSQSVTVMQDGSIEYPLIGRVNVGGQTVDSVTSTLTTKLAEYVRHPYVSVMITQLAQPSVLVLGDVKNPGKYQLRSDARVTDAIAAAGGLAEVNGDLPEARVSDPQGNITHIPLQQLLHDGDVALDRTLGEGDVVYVPGPTLINVTVSGAVDHPGVVAIPEGDKVSMAVAQAGDSTAANSDLNHIRVLRRGPDGKMQSFTIDLYKALKDGDDNADIALQKDDEVYVPQMRAKTGSLLTNAGILDILGRLLIP